MRLYGSIFLTTLMKIVVEAGQREKKRSSCREKKLYFWANNSKFELPVMAIVDNRPPSEGGGGSKVWGLFKLPFRNTGNVTTHTTTSSSSYQIEGSNAHNSNNHHGSSSSSSVSSVARSLLPTRRRLRLDPRNKLYFPNEPGKQVQSAIKIKNTSKSHVAFKFQTTAPKSCFMRPPGAILAPGESIIATGNNFWSIFKFVEPLDSNEKQMDQKRKVKFKIMSLKVKGMMDYVPELHRLAEAEAALESHKKPAEETGPKIINEGLVIDEWKERRERYLARQQVESVDSV
ncbi:Major sperm protein [Cynara cardunculus var. scolymus]|uniref:Major sperm protein n=1 Tax=Cynara cardunculus var. scolymus TaxID=59895 RepID=A0A103Y1Z3_CYNCS|nr:Major sperm protein [Cynara cardunculus var. scolymus]